MEIPLGGCEILVSQELLHIQDGRALLGSDGRAGMPERMAPCPLGNRGTTQVFRDELFDSSLANGLAIPIEKKVVSRGVWSHSQVICNGHWCLLHQGNFTVNLPLALPNVQPMPNMVNIVQAEIADLTHPPSALEKHLKDSHVPKIPSCHQPGLIALATGEMGANILLPLGDVNGLHQRLADVLMGEAKLEVAPDGS